MKIICTADEYKVFQDIKATKKIDELKELIIAMGVQDIEFHIRQNGETALDEISTWLLQAVGRTFDGDGAHGAQCKDFANAYAEWLHHPLKPSDAAKTWEIEQDSYWQKIPHEPGKIPQTGDIVIWSSWKENPYGHIAVVLDAAENEFRSVDQNWDSPDLAKGSPAAVVTHTYDTPQVIGYLRPAL